MYKNQQPGVSPCRYVEVCFPDMQPAVYKYGTYVCRKYVTGASRNHTTVGQNYNPSKLTNQQPIQIGNVWVIKLMWLCV